MKCIIVRDDSNGDREYLCPIKTMNGEVCSGPWTEKSYQAYIFHSQQDANEQLELLPREDGLVVKVIPKPKPQKRYVTLTASYVGTELSQGGPCLDTLVTEALNAGATLHGPQYFTAGFFRQCVIYHEPAP